jgi:hypothetical protein
MVLVELKFAVAPPGWMEGVIARLAPWRVSFSKYGAAMEAAAGRRPSVCSVHQADSLNQVGTPA